MRLGVSGDLRFVRGDRISPKAQHILRFCNLLLAVVSGLITRPDAKGGLPEFDPGLAIYLPGWLGLAKLCQSLVDFLKLREELFPLPPRRRLSVKLDAVEAISLCFLLPQEVGVTTPILGYHLLAGTCSASLLGRGVILLSP